MDPTDTVRATVTLGTPFDGAAKAALSRLREVVAVTHAGGPARQCARSG
jgi:hypothetical protein